MLNYVYVVSVKVHSSFGVTKSIQKRQVLGYTKSYVTVDDFGSKLKLPIDRCSADLEGAKAISEARATELIDKLEKAIHNLRQPAKCDDWSSL